MKDVLYVFHSYFKDCGVLTEEKEKAINERVDFAVDDATDYAEQAPYAEPESALRYVYEE